MKTSKQGENITIKITSMLYVASLFSLFLGFSLEVADYLSGRFFIMAGFFFLFSALSVLIISFAYSE